MNGAFYDTNSKGLLDSLYGPLERSEKLFDEGAFAVREIWDWVGTTALARVELLRVCIDAGILVTSTSFDIASIAENEYDTTRNGRLFSFADARYTLQYNEVDLYPHLMERVQ